jgi:hypothetical protein
VGASAASHEGSRLNRRTVVGVNAMPELKESLNRVLEEHQHESGLHIIGGRRRLIDRLVKLFEELKQEDEDSRPDARKNN